MSDGRPAGFKSRPRRRHCVVALRAFLLLASLSAVLFAGCTSDNSGDGQSAQGEGALAYNGASSGTQSDSFDCGGSADISVSANLGSGSLTFTVSDGAGKQVYSKSTSGAGQIADSKEDVKGTSGTWTVKAVRGSGFTGQYAAAVSC